MAWVIDQSHSQVGFSIRHMMISKVRGRFETFQGTVELDEQNPSAAKVDVTIDASSINTRDAQRDGHLKAADFFDVANHPNITFVSTSVDQVDGQHAKLHGDLTIRGVTKPVTLDVTFEGKAKSPWGTTSAGFSATTTIDREEWGLNFNQALETGGVLVGKEVEISIDVELVEQA
ncbi:YceI family protein [Chloroflexia bacterium SDU3-3]|nr:YceI family protein [Chloroflexia bacterium SDU3-3]